MALNEVMAKDLLAEEIAKHKQDKELLECAVISGLTHIVVAKRNLKKNTQALWDVECKLNTLYIKQAFSDQFMPVPVIDLVVDVTVPHDRYPQLGPNSKCLCPKPKGMEKLYKNCCGRGVFVNPMTLKPSKRKGCVRSTSINSHDLFFAAMFR